MDLRRGPSLWSYDGQAKIAFLPLPPHASYRRSALQTMYNGFKGALRKGDTALLKYPRNLRVPWRGDEPVRPG